MSFAVKPLFVTGSLSGPQGATGAQGAQGSLTPNVVFTRGTDISLTDGNNNDYSISSGTLFIVTNATGSPTITGIANGTIGRFIIIINADPGLTNLNFTNEDANSSPSNRLALSSSSIFLSFSFS